jgi:hypothetical protein
MDTGYRFGPAAPLCPAGHLPHEGEDRLVARSANHIDLSAQDTISAGAMVGPLVVSLLVGEMPGRAEGGNSTRQGSVSPSMANPARKGQPQ